jgi:cell division protein FtsL
MAGSAARAEARPRRAPQPRPSAPQRQAQRSRVTPASSKRRPQRRVAGGVVWIAAVAALLGGIVALNVAVLRLNMEIERLEERRSNLAAENQVLALELSSKAAAWRIEAVATRKLGLVQAVDPTYLRLEPSER